MTRVRVMYWKEIPVQVQAEDGDRVVSAPLDERFQRGVDAVAMFDGSAGGDEYLMAWEWGEYSDADGEAGEAAATLAALYNARFPRDFVARIRKLHQTDERDPRPGAADHWLRGDVEASS